MTTYVQGKGKTFKYSSTAMGLAFALCFPALAGSPSHGLSTFGDLKYKPGFAHFDYVNPNAPKGGRMTTMGTGALSTFNSFNPFIDRGDTAQGIGLIYDSLMTSSADEPDSMYGLVADIVEVADDRMSVTFRLRRDAKFADGSPITSADCVFTFDILKEKGSPRYGRISLKDVVKAEALDPLAVRYTFTGSQVRDLPATVASLAILPKAFYASREFDQTTLDPPLGSGPYKIGDFQPGKYVTYKRREDYWARDLGVARGRYNFDELRYEFYGERIASFENFKSGNIDLREEFTSKEWATSYDFAAVKDHRVLLLDLPDENPSGTQGFWINTRKEKFQDVRVRQALDLAFDYEWTNKNLFYGLYKRTSSFFENSDMMAKGKPGPDELKILEPLRAKLPSAVFDDVYVPPVTDGSGGDRRLMRDSNKLLADAGWTIKDSKRVNAKGETLDIEFLVTDVTSERILGKYVENLKALGIAVNIRKIDETAYTRRVKSFDYDIVSTRFVMSLTPGLELRSMFGSEAATMEASNNRSGIKDPVVDALIATIVEATSRADLTTAARALDRVLRASHYWVPHWHKGSHWIAHWDKYDRPAKKPKYDRGILDTWWYDESKAAKLKAN